MKKKLASSIILSICFLVSCYGTPRETPTQAVIPTSSTSQTPTAIPQTATATKIEITPTAVGGCSGNQGTLPESLDGRAILGGKNTLFSPSLKLSDTSPYQLDLKSGDKISLPPSNLNDSLLGFSVSPDRRWLAYRTLGESGPAGLYIVGNNGVLFKRYPMGRWWNIMDWLDNKNLLIGNKVGHNPYPTIIFNPFTDKTEQVLMPDFPDIFKGYSGEMYSWDRYQETETVYNKDLNVVVYPKTPIALALYDISNQKTIVEVKDKSASSRAPMWLSNGKGFIIDITFDNTLENFYHDDLYEIDLDGNIKQLTHLADLGYVNVAIQNYNESANGEYIAFWFAQIHSGPSRLAIYDVVTKNIKVFCTIVGGYVPPVWSPSKHQLLVDGTFDSLDNYGTIFVDVETGLMAQVEKGFIPLGWMVAP